MNCVDLETETYAVDANLATTNRTRDANVRQFL